MGVTTDLLAGPLTGPALAAVAPLVPRGVAAAAASRIFAPQEPPPGCLDRLGLGAIVSPAELRTNARQLAALKREIGGMVARYHPRLAVPVEILHGECDGAVPIGIHAGL
jgi:hypothetical protein